MKIIGRERLSEYVQGQREVQPAVASWLCEVEKVHWKRFEDVKMQFPLAEWIDDRQILFPLSNRQFGINACLSYDAQILLVQRIERIRKTIGLFDQEVK